MAWTTPRTWAIGQLVSANDMNEQLRDNLLHLKIAVGDDGKIPALNSTYIADVSGANLTNVAKLASNNDFTAAVSNFTAGALTRLVLPVGADRWAT